MGHLPFAFSVHNFVTSVGSYAGFASIIGLAILVLLYFAHARETASLREQGEVDSARVAELEQRIAQLGTTPPASAATNPPARVAGAARQAPAAVQPPVGAPAPVRTPAPASAAGVAAARAPGVAVTYPGAPAGVGAPALSAATRLIPGGSAPPPAPTSAPALTPAPATAAGAAPAGTNGTGEHTVPPAPEHTVPPPREHAVAPARAPLPAAVAAAPRPTVQIRGTAASGRAGSAPRRRPAAGARPKRMAPGLVVLLGLLLVAGIVVALVGLTSNGGSSQSKPSASSAASNAPVSHRAGAGQLANSSVTVAVLNGTPTGGLAHRVSTRLAASGFKSGSVTSASDQTRTATVVAYMPGNKQGALAVAKDLKLGPASVQPVDQGTQAIACPPPSACTATVVVTVGADLATL